MGAFITFVTVMFVSFTVSFWDAFVVAKLWNWFAAVPFSIAQMTTLQVYGLVMMVNVLRYKAPASSDSTPVKGTVIADIAKHQALFREAARKTASAMWNRFCASLTILGMAALVHWWMAR